MHPAGRSAREEYVPPPFPHLPVDQRLFLELNRHRTHPALDWVMALASNVDFWAPWLVLLVLLVAWLGGTRGRLALACVGLTLAATEVTVGPLKRVFHRPRPDQVLAGVRKVDLDRHARPRLLALGKPLEVRFSPAPAPPGAPPAAAPTAVNARANRSFPSGHVTDNFAVATVLTLLFRRRGWWYLPVAALVGVSRVYTGAHWPSDVLLSALLGAGWALCLAAILELAWAQAGPRWVPTVWRAWPRLFGGGRAEAGTGKLGLEGP